MEDFFRFFTDRQKEVYKLREQKMTFAQIGNTLGISQEKLCAELQRRHCDIGRSAYQKYEDGRLNIRISVLIELKKLYNCTYDDFFEGLDIQPGDAE